MGEAAWHRDRQPRGHPTTSSSAVVAAAPKKPARLFWLPDRPSVETIQRHKNRQVLPLGPMQAGRLTATPPTLPPLRLGVS